MEALTIKQVRAFEVMKELIAKGGGSPSYEEVRAALGLASLQSVARYVHILAAKGYLEPGKGKARSIRLCGHADVLGNSDHLTIRGIRVGGRCKLVGEEKWKSTRIPADTFFPSASFFIEAYVKTELSEKAILFEDLVAVQISDHFKPGETIVVKSPKGLMVGVGLIHKTKTADAQQFLRCDGADSPYEIKSDDEVLGKVVGVLRRWVTRKQ